MNFNRVIIFVFAMLAGCEDYPRLTPGLYNILEKPSQVNCSAAHGITFTVNVEHSGGDSLNSPFPATLYILDQRNIVLCGTIGCNSPSTNLGHRGNCAYEVGQFSYCDSSSEITAPIEPLNFQIGPDEGLVIEEAPSDQNENTETKIEIVCSGGQWLFYAQKVE